MNNTQATNLTSYLTPKYWGTWLGLGLIRLIAFFPYPLQYLCGHMIGLIIWLLPLPKKRIIRINLEICFPETTQGYRRKILFKNCLSMGMGLIEIAMSWWSNDRSLKKIVQIEGLENLKSAVQSGKGVILLGAHFTTLELGGRLLRLYSPFHVMYRDQKNLLFDAVMTRSRQRHYQKAIHRNNIKELLQSLKTNHAVWYASDQHFGGPKQVFAPFFGIQAGSNPATSRIAKTTGARVVPFFQIRLPGLQGYKLIIQPALQDFPAGDIQQDTARINQVIEQAVRQKPEQYLWAHKRFKSQQDDHSKNIYNEK